MTESEIQKVMVRVAREYHLQRSRAVKRGIIRARAKNGKVFVYEVKSNGHRTTYTRLGRISHEKAGI